MDENAELRARIDLINNVRPGIIIPILARIVNKPRGYFGYARSVVKDVHALATR